MKTPKPVLYLLTILTIYMTDIQAQRSVNYEESKIPKYILPEVLVSGNGKKVKNITDWQEDRRKEIIRLYEDEVFGKVPSQLDLKSSGIIEQSDTALNNTAVRKQVKLSFENQQKTLEATLLIYLPKGVVKPPLFLGYNFIGNHTIINDPNIFLTNSWIENNESLGITENKATESSRGVRSNRWAIDAILAAGYGIATMYYGDIDPDKNDFSDGIHPLLYNQNQKRPADHEWGSLAAWAWGLSRAMDYLQKDGDIDPNKIVLMGHSRLGKAALWAGALDERFAIVISNDSGCGGAAISRRKFGETVQAINDQFPHWFNTNFKKYNSNEDQLSVEQHWLIALMAPRPVYIASAAEDLWADPRGEFLSGYYATPVYELFDKKGIESIDSPKIHEPVRNTVGYHIRAGIHDVTDYDWTQFILFSNKHFGLNNSSEPKK